MELVLRNIFLKMLLRVSIKKFKKMEISIKFITLAKKMLVLRLTRILD